MIDHQRELERSDVRARLSFTPERFCGTDFRGWWRRECVRRRRVLHGCNANPVVREYVHRRCKRDFDFWSDNFAWTRDPRKNRKPGHLPFVLWDFQREVARWFLGEDERYLDSNGELWPIALDKSRDMGATWTMLACIVWQWQFHGESFGILARMERDVDVGDQEGVSLFGRLRYLIKHQPAWMRPDGWREAKRNRRVDTHMQLKNPSNGGVIFGSSTVGDAFRQHRFRRVLVDEAAAIDLLERMLDAINDVTPAQVLISSVQGRNNDFARVVHGELGDVVEEGVAYESKGIGWLHIRLHYSRHPAKDPSTPEGKAWRKREKARRSAESWAQEQEIDYHASMPDRCWPEMDRDLHVYSDEMWEDAVEPFLWRTNVEWIEAWDFGNGPSATFVCWAAHVSTRDQDMLVFVDYRSWGLEEVDEIADDVAEAGWWTATNTGGRDPDARVGDMSGNLSGNRMHGGRAQEEAESWFENLARYGIDVEGIAYSAGSIQAMRLNIKHGKVFFSPSCAIRHHPNRPSLVECFEGYHWSPSSLKAGRPKPNKRDASSHGADAAQFAMLKAWGDPDVEMIEQDLGVKKRWQRQHT